MSTKEKEREVTFEINEHFGVISVSANGWQRELNMVSWNGGMPKYDLRDWDKNHKSMSRGITLTKEELKTLETLILELKL
ncbi:YdbC family protein [Sinanaerobacter sp. ZZT-01]|uniref:YdbC family protein n=1 Tax=Sinanaerobacter sp. ZZT-01 TaxID=3111540 RepID=UPI002D767615|nr:PC4/YdbC family ssDNA-binding protein [Sinanaerobacter sp. ZZT-01]WRR92293.1 PC4/YdbC family ssDNA-binding protein [Sinanaerobacter sp. ZZT-01]